MFTLHLSRKEKKYGKKNLDEQVEPNLNIQYLKTKIKKVRLVTVSRRCSKKSVPHMLPKYCENYLIKRYCLVKLKWILHSLAWYLLWNWQKCKYRKLVPRSSLLNKYICRTPFDVFFWGSNLYYISWKK